MRAGLVLLLLALVAEAGDLGDRIWVARVTTERSSFGSSPTRQTLYAPALPVEDGFLIAVGFALEPPDDKDEALKVTAIDPDGKSFPAELIGGDQELRCTLFYLRGTKPDPVALEAAPREVGDEVILLSRQGEVMRFAPRRASSRIEAKASSPLLLYALPAEAQYWQGGIAMTPEGKLVGFVDMRPTVSDGVGIMLGVGAQTPVLVPADTFADVPRTLPRKDRPRGWLGVNLAPFDEDHEAYYGLDAPVEGAFVTGVAEGSPADRAGVKLHDVLVSIGNLPFHFERMEDWDPLLRAVQRLPLGKPLPCRVLRLKERPGGGYDTETLDLPLTLDARPLDFADAPETEIPDLGFRVKPLTQDRRRGGRVPADVEGVVISRIERASAAQIGGLEIDDIIQKVDDQAVPDAASLEKALGASEKAGRTRIVFFVRRGSATLFVTVQRGQ
jgi:serine protease Do